MFDGRGELVEISTGLDEPGPEVGAVLAGIDVNAVSGFDRIVVLKAHQHLLARSGASVRGYVGGG